MRSGKKTMLVAGFFILLVGLLCSACGGGAAESEDIIMDVLEKVQDIVKAASDKTSEIIEVSRLKAGIAEERRALTDQMAKLGAIYYELYKNGEVLTPDAVNICMIADKYSNKIEERQAELTRINEANAAKRAAKNPAPVSTEQECPECGSKNPEGAKFCFDCGAKLPEIIDVEASEVVQEAEQAQKRYCVSCGAELGEGKKFCSECGANNGEIQ